MKLCVHSNSGSAKRHALSHLQICGFLGAISDFHSRVGLETVTTKKVKIVAVMQKFFDQAISGNWSYNPTHFPDNEIPVSVMAQDLLTTYKYGWKTSYYQNTYDNKKDDDEIHKEQQLNSLVDDILSGDEGECDACNV